MELETEQIGVGLEGYETLTPYQVLGRLWAGWHCQVALCLLAWAFMLSLQPVQAERCPGSQGRKSTG